MSIWSMTGADLAREINQPAPVTVLRGGQASTLADVLARIAALPGKDQAELVRAFQSALKPEPKRIGGMTYRNAEDFFPAFNKAREAATAVAGPRWWLDPSVSLMARVPGAWTALKGEMGTWRSPRDVNFPAARFWPGGVLPTGPEYAEHGPVAKVGGAQAERDKAWATRKALAFNLEPTPENIDMDEAA